MMKIQLVMSAAAALAVACSGPQAKHVDDPGSKRLDDMEKRVGDIDTRLKKIESVLSDLLEEEREPDPNAVYAVPIEGDPYDGAEHAKVTLVEGFEFACPYCAQSWPTLQQLLRDYAGDIKVVYKYYVVHQQAVAPGLAACAANQQGKFKAMAQLIWDKGFGGGDLSVDKLAELAKEANLDLDAYGKDLQSETCMSWLKRNYAELNQLGVNGTPVFYVNGRYLSGAQPVANFKKLIDEELAKANKAIASGTPVESLYEKLVLAPGKSKP